MDSELLNRFRQRLEAMQAELISNDEKGHESTGTVGLDQSRVGRLSRMDAMQGQAIAAEGRRRRRIRMESVKEALDRIDAGNYGICISCEEDIDPRRLDFDPAAALCITCARAEEGP